MPNIKFQHVFSALLVLSFLSAFVLPEKGADRLRGHLQGLFTWVSRPVQRASGVVAERVAERRDEDARSAAGVKRENDALRVAIVSLQEQLRELRQLNAERDLVGPVRDLTVPAEVTGGDSGVRDSLSLAVTSAAGVKAGQAVVYTGGLAGRIDRAGLSGAQVRLVTDSGFRVQVSFGRYQKNGDRLEYLQLGLPVQIVEGVGGGGMVAVNLTMKAVKEGGLAVGDWATLADRDWPMALQGYRVGRVVEIKAAKAALFAEVRIEAEANLMGLREVMVMTK